MTRRSRSTAVRAKVTGLFVALLLCSGTTACQVAPSAAGPGATAAAQPQTPAPKTPLTVGVGSDITAFDVLVDPAKNRRTGFDYRVALWLGANSHPGFEPVLVPINIADRLDAITDGRVSMVIDIFSITDERRARIGMAGPYLLDRQGFLSRQDLPIRNQLDVADKSVCTVQHTTSDAGLQELKKTVDFRIDYESSSSDCVKRVERGDSQIFSTGQLILSGFAAGSQLSLVVSPFTFGNAEELGVGYRRGDTATCVMLRDGIADLIRNGAWDEFFKLEFAGINPDSGHRPDPQRLDRC